MMTLSPTALRLTLRSLWRSPAFTAVAILTLALAIGANSAIFSVVNGVLLQPLPYPDSRRLVALHRETDPDEADISVPDAEDLRRDLAGMSAFALYFQGWAFDLTGQGDPERVTATVAEPEYFAVLQTEPLLGRIYSRSDGATPLAVLSHAFWLRRFRGESVVGRTLILSDVPYTVVGVMPRDFSALDPRADLWVPPAAATPWAATSRGSNNFEVIGRLAPGVELPALTQELRGLTSRLVATHPTTNGGKVLVAAGLVSMLTAPVRPAVWALFAAVVLVLLIASANLASLMLARAEIRAAEQGLRVALGANRARLVGGVLVESLVLAIPGGLLGLGLAVWGTEAILVLAGASLPRGREVGVDGAVLAFAAFLTLGTTLLFGVGPAIRAGRIDPARSLDGGRGGLSPGRQRTFAGLVVAEVALAATLLVGALLLGRSFRELQRVDLGFRPGGLVSVEIVLPESRYGTRAAQTAAFAAILERVKAAPGVQGAATVIGAPLGVGGAVGHRLLIDGWTSPDPDVEPSARSRPVAGDYFDVMGIALRGGRVFDRRDTEHSERVAIVNESFARAVWGEADPIGRRLAWRFSAEPSRWMTVVGVVGDVRAGSLREGDEIAVYTPYAQREPEWQRFGILMVRGTGAHDLLVRGVRQAVLGIDPSLPIGRVLPMVEAARQVLTAERVSAIVFMVFSVVAALMAAQGLYGLLALVVGARRREIGIRLALGALPAHVLAGVLGRALRLVAIGFLLGGLAAAWLSRFVRGQLYGVAAEDPVVYAAAAAGLILVSLAAAWLPARRAAGVDPMTALRAE